MFVLIILVVLTGVVAALDVSQWDADFGKGVLAETNGLLIDIFLIAVVVALYDYRRRTRGEVADAQKELTRLRMSSSIDAVLRKTELIDFLTKKGKKPHDLDRQNLGGASLNGYDLSGVDMSFVTLEGAALVRTKLAGSKLLSADFGESVLVEADLAGASLYEASFRGALLSGADLTGADVTYADFRGAQELTCDQLTSASNWEKAYRDKALACGSKVPKPGKPSFGAQFRQQLRGRGNPFHPFVLGTVIEADGSTHTVAHLDDEA